MWMMQLQKSRLPVKIIDKHAPLQELKVKIWQVNQLCKVTNKLNSWPLRWKMYFCVIAVSFFKGEKLQCFKINMGLLLFYKKKLCILNQDLQGFTVDWPQ